MTNETLEEPAFPCPALIADIDRIRKEAGELAKTDNRFEGWYGILWEARSAILEPYYGRLTAYKIQQEHRQKHRQELKLKRDAKL